MKKIEKPTDHIPSFYQHYMDCVPDDGNLLNHLQDIMNETEALVSTLSAEQLAYRYREDKWTIKDIVLHLADCERIIIYRSTRIARGDNTNLPGFDENLFVDHAHANKRDIDNILTELKACRAASIPFIASLDDTSLNRLGTANGFELSARLLVNHLYGHHKHHLDIIKERYLS